MSVLVLGYYYCDNLGDDLLLESLRIILKDYNVTYHNIVKIKECDLTKYNIIILGGGDLLNDFFGQIYYDPLLEYNGYKLALGVGTSYEECNNREYIKCFDDIIIRNKNDLSILSNNIGSLHVNHGPDLSFILPVEIIPHDNKKIVGFFLIGSMYKNKHLMFNICTFINWLILLDYHIHLIPMGTGEHENDLLINNEIYHIFEHTNKIKNYNKLNIDQLLHILTYLDFAVCARFHAHILCTKYNIPFISIPITRKVKLYMSELPQSCQYLTINIYNNCDIIGINEEDMKNKFLNLVNNIEIIKKDLLYFSTIQYNYFLKNKIKPLLDNHRKRLINSTRLI